MHLTVLLADECKDIPVNKIFGLMKCSMLPPPDLLFPVLPTHVNGKPVFALCEKCAKLKQDYCDHADDERVIKGTWTSVEIQKAIELGYRIVDIHEMYHYESKGENFGKFVDT